MISQGYVSFCLLDYVISVCYNVTSSGVNMPEILPSLARAFNSAGRSKSKIAQDMDITVQTLRDWFYGKRLVPVHMRERLAEVMGKPIDWPQACAEYHALRNGPKLAPEPPKIRPAGVPPAHAPAKAPQTPQRPAPRPIVAKPAPTPPENKDAAPKGLFGAIFGVPLFRDDEAEA